MSYAWHKLRLAVHCLAEAGSQRERLTAAIADHLASLRPKDLPLTWRPEFTMVIDHLRLRSVENREAEIRWVVSALDDDEVDATIRSILRLYDAVIRYQPIQAAEEVSESIANPSTFGKELIEDAIKK